MSSTHVSWMFELSVKENRDADFQAMMAEMAAATERNEPGTLDYEWYVSADGRILHLFERYMDSSAALAHMHTFDQRYGSRFFDVLQPERMTLYGAPSDAVKQGLAPWSPLLLTRAAGFSRP